MVCDCVALCVMPDGFLSLWTIFAAIVTATVLKPLLNVSGGVVPLESQ